MKYKLINGIKLVFIFSVFALLLACGSKAKKKDMPYLKSKSVAPLKIPSDLKQPEKSVMYSIPDVAAGQTSQTVDPEELSKPPDLIKTEKADNPDD